MVVVGWIPPSQGYLKRNLDSCAKGCPGAAGAGGLFRGSDGGWVLGFVHNIGCASAIRAELLVLWTGLSIATRNGWHELLIETDSTTVVDLVLRTSIPHRAYKALVSDCRRLLRRVRGAILSHAFREANRCMDNLANKALSFLVETHD